MAEASKGVSRKEGSIFEFLGAPQSLQRSNEYNRMEILYFSSIREAAKKVFFSGPTTKAPSSLVVNFKKVLFSY